MQQKISNLKHFGNELILDLEKTDSSYITTNPKIFFRYFKFFLDDEIQYSKCCIKHFCRYSNDRLAIFWKFVWV